MFNKILWVFTTFSLLLPHIVWRTLNLVVSYQCIWRWCGVQTGCRRAFSSFHDILHSGVSRKEITNDKFDELANIKVLVCCIYVYVYIYTILYILFFIKYWSMRERNTTKQCGINIYPQLMVFKDVLCTTNSTYTYVVVPISRFSIVGTTMPRRQYSSSSFAISLFPASPLSTLVKVPSTFSRSSKRWRTTPHPPFHPFSFCLSPHF